jgi:hypothetical protein
VDKFLEMFQVKIDPTEVLKEYLLFTPAASGGIGSGLFVTISGGTGHAWYSAS